MPHSLNKIFTTNVNFNTCTSIHVDIDTNEKSFTHRVSAKFKHILGDQLNLYVIEKIP